jgi:hypothetical protein
MTHSSTGTAQTTDGFGVPLVKPIQNTSYYIPVSPSLCWWWKHEYTITGNTWTSRMWGTTAQELKCGKCGHIKLKDIR